MRFFVTSCRWIPAVLFVMAIDQAQGEEMVQGRRSLVLENNSARLVVDIAGGSIPEFRFRDSEINPLNWGRRTPGDKPGAMGHFLCCDRWGPPSDAEGRNGMPYHGEAANVTWQVLQHVRKNTDGIQARMAAELPLAGMSVERTVTMADDAPIFAVNEKVTNRNKLGRIFNIVQHPTIGPPFLDQDTVVDTNGRRGFAQSGSLPNPEHPDFFWPKAITQDGEQVALRHMTDNDQPSVTSFVIDEELGWVTACNASKGLLLGYIWKRRDYPWFNHWWHLKDGLPNARGLEFGTTGLHQPFPVLVKKREIFGRQLFEHLDTGHSTTKTYACFLCRIPADFGGVGNIAIDGVTLVITERADPNPRSLKIPTDGLFQL